MWIKVLVNAVLILLISGEQTDNVNVLLDASRVVGPLRHFWESTGFCPPDPHQDFRKFIFTNDELQNLAYIGSVPNKGIKQVRIHWLLDLVSMEQGTNQLVYNFTYLDKAINWLVRNDLKPGFELMGNPSNFFSDFDDTAQIYAWRDLIASLGKHLIEAFGLKEVSQWNFESWNEPQNKHHFDGLHVSIKGYLMYYDACSEGLKMAHPSLRLGGPATGYPDGHPIFWYLLQHCNNGTNFFTGERGVRLDYISFHIKGDEHSLTILKNETVVLEEIAHLFPKYKTSPIYNDEGDPLVGWSLGEEWRADATYAAIVVKILAQHQEMFLKTNFSVRYNLLSNDNGFISYPPYYFRQRTLLARFQMNHSNPRKVEFVKKPILSVMGLLALLGDEQIKTSISFENDNHDDFGVMATVIKPHGLPSTNDWELAAMLYNSNDTSGRTSLSQINISVVNLPSRQDVAFVVYKLDNDNGNPFRLWKDMGSPVFPSDDQFNKLRLQQEPVRSLGPRIPSSNMFNILLTLPLPGVSLLHVCAKPVSPPQKVEGVRLIRVSSYEVLVTWMDVQSRCLLSYQVLYSVKSSHGPFKQVNKVDIIFTSFHHLLSQEDRNYVQGWYSIVAVDYWGRHSPSSLPVTFNSWTS